MRVPALPFGDGTVPGQAPSRGRLRHLVLVAGVLVVLLYTQLPVGPVNPLLAVVRILVGVAYAVTALLLSGEGGQRENSRLFAVMALLWTTGQLDERSTGPLPLVGLLTGQQVDVVLAAILLRWPGSRLHRVERDFILVAAVWTTLIQLAWVLTVPAGDLGLGPQVWWPAAWSDSALARRIDLVSTAGILVLVAVFVALLIRRWRHVRGLDRTELAPVLVAGAATAALLVAFQVAVLLPMPRWLFALLHAGSDLARVSIPAAFLIAALARHLVRAGVADLMVRIPVPCPPEVLRDALRIALQDPTLRLLSWVQGRAAYVDENGSEVDVPRNRPQLAVPIATDSGEPLAVILADPTLAHHQPVLRAATAVAQLVLENAKLHASLLARLHDVKESRARLVGAELTERRRLERDLHDGAQQRLLALKTRLGVARARAHDPEAMSVLEEARQDLGLALQELRDLAHGIHPTVLTQAGLRAALEKIADQMPVPVGLDVLDRRYRSEAETALYFVACEALANVVKHAGACSVHVSVREGTGEYSGLLHLDIVDTGSGGACLRAQHGLMGLQDRLAAVGGRLGIESSSAGTHVRAAIPCG